MDGSWIWSLFCPLMMIVMMIVLMFGMRGRGRNHHTPSDHMQMDNENQTGQMREHKGGSKSCCGNHQEHHQVKADGHCSSHHHQAKRHNWMMLLCCVLPVVLVAAALIAGRFGGTSINILPFLWVLICPLLHLIFMPLIMGKKKR